MNNQQNVNMGQQPIAPVGSNVVVNSTPPVTNVGDQTPNISVSVSPPLPINLQRKDENKSYMAKPTDLPNLDDIKKKDEVREETKDILKEENSDEIILPLAPSPLPEEITSKDTFKPIKDSLEDIVPNVGIPKAVMGKMKENNLSSPEGILGQERNQKDLVPKEKILKVQEETPTSIQGPLNSMEQLLQQAIEKNASDLHITVGYPVTIRVDGELESLNDKIVTPNDSKALIQSILSDEKKELLEVNKEIDFAYSFKDNENSRFRINAYYSKGELSAAFRLIPAHIRTIEELMLPQIYHRFSQLKQGLILVTGPTGHGKSTTIAAILEDINRTRFCHIVTIEDPIEYIFKGKKSLIDQREMNSDTHSWTVALKSALRQDPDVILVGEMRDYETIAAAITLAETGHLVFATLHTNSASQTIDRIIDVFPENQQSQVKTQLANILEAVVAQRLIPLDTGGRRAVSEILLGVPSIKNLIREGKTHQIDNVIRTSSDVGMVSLESSLVKLVREGVISIEKAQQYAVYPEEIIRFMKK